jgi:hypothetical protein
MSATHHFCESNGAGEVETQDISNVNFGSTDAPNLVVITYPIVRGDASFEKYVRCLFTGTWTEISNMKFWKSAGAYVTGEAIKAAANVVYATPSATPNADSDIPITEGAALAIESAEGEIIIEYGASGVSGYTGYIRLQTRSTILTPTGAGNQKTFTMQYDET